MEVTLAVFSLGDKRVKRIKETNDDDELNINPPAPCQIGKRPPAPKPKRESAGHQGVAGGGYKSEASRNQVAFVVCLFY